MNGQALGLIETMGLVCLINAVDAMLKAATVELATPIIKLDGGVVSVQVIPRPHEDLGGILSFTKAAAAPKANG